MLIVLHRKRIMAVLAVLIVLQVILGVFLCVDTFGKKDTALIDFTVVIDAGHGGIDGGVVAQNGVKESDLNLEYSKELGKLFVQCGFNVVYTRTDGNGLYGLPTNGFKQRDMKKRKEIIEKAKPNLVLSIHMNKFSSSVRSGPQVFFQEGYEQGQLLAESLQKVFNAFTGNKHEAIDGDFYICRESPCTAVIVECGFLSNENDSAQLQTEEYRKTICQKIFEGVMLYLYST